MSSLAKRGALTCALVAAVVAVVAGPAAAVTITPASTAYDATLVSATNAVFTGGGLTIQCNTHTSSGTTTNPADNTLTIPKATNTYTHNGGRCPYTGLGGGTAGVTITADWTLTANSVASGVASGTIDVPNSAANINLTGLGGLLTCNLTVNKASVPGTYTNATSVLATNGANTVPTTGCSLNVNATQQESLDVAGGISVT